MMLQIQNHQDAFERFGRALGRTIRAEKDKVQIHESSFDDYKQAPDPNGPEFDGLDEAMKVFFSHVRRWKMKWKSLPTLDSYLEGSINILPLTEIHKIGDTTFLPDENPTMRGFHLLDYFYNEGAVGFYLGQPERGLFLFKFDGETQPLQLDFSGYLQLLLYTKGVGYWQNLIITHLTKKVQGNVLGIRENMPKLFPDFSEQGFIELYESVRLR